MNLQPRLWLRSRRRYLQAVPLPLPLGSPELIQAQRSKPFFKSRPWVARPVLIQTPSPLAGAEFSCTSQFTAKKTAAGPGY